MDELELKAWREAPRTVTLTNAEWAKLSVSIEEIIQKLEGERDEWLELEGQTHRDGTPVCENAAGLAEYWQGVIDEWKTLLSKIDSKEG